MLSVIAVILAEALRVGPIGGHVAAPTASLISMPFVGEKRQRAHKNAVDDPITVRDMIEHGNDDQIGVRHA